MTMLPLPSLPSSCSCLLAGWTLPSRSCPCLQPPPPMLMGTQEPIAAPQPGASQAELASPESLPISPSHTSSAMSGTGIATIVGIGVPLAACAGEGRLPLSVNNLV